MRNDDLDPDLVEIAERWSIGELTAKLAEGDVAADAYVLRVLATRVAARVTNHRDPRSLVIDLAEVVSAIAEAIRLAIPAAGELDAREDRVDDYEETTVDLANTEHGLEVMRDWF